MMLHPRVRETLKRWGLLETVRFVLPKHHRPAIRLRLAKTRVRLRPGTASDRALAQAMAGMALYKSEHGTFEEALGLCDAALSLDARCAQALACRGLILGRQGLKERARADLSACLELDSAQAEAHLGLAEVLFKDFEVDAAMEHYRTARRLRPGLRWPAGDAVIAGDHLEVGLRLFDNYALQSSSKKTVGLLRRAAEHFEASLGQRETLEAWEKLLWCYPLSGRWNDFTRALRRICELKERDPRREEFRDGQEIVFLPDFCANAIGAIGWLTTHVKKKLLLGTRERLLLCVPDGRSINRAFLAYFRPFVEMIESPEDIAALAPRKALFEMPLAWGMSFDGPQEFLGAAVAKINLRWQDEGRAPLLSLSPSDRGRGWEVLRGLGIPRDSWWVCVHARTPTFYKEGPRSSEAFRNADIQTYLKALRLIADRGGYVFRLGDPTMPPLPPMERVIDYARSDFRSDWMDVFLGSQCRFYIGTQSGLSAIANSFGVPSIQTNNLPILCTAYLPDDVVVPKLLRKKDGRLMPFAEMMTEPYVGAAAQYVYDELPIEIVSNTEDDIASAVRDMADSFDALGKRRVPSPTALQTRFDELACARGLSLSGRVDAGFLERHRDLF